MAEEPWVTSLVPHAVIHSLYSTYWAELPWTLRRQRRTRQENTRCLLMRKKQLNNTQNKAGNLSTALSHGERRFLRLRGEASFLLQVQDSALRVWVTGSWRLISPSPLEASRRPDTVAHFPLLLQASPFHAS